MSFPATQASKTCTAGHRLKSTTRRATLRTAPPSAGASLAYLCITAAPPLLASLPFAGTSSAPAQNTGRECWTLLAGAVVERGYDISRLSCFGEHESEVLLPLTQLQVIGRPSKTCVPEEWVAGDGPTPAPYHPPGSPQYPRRLGPDRVQLKQLLEESAAEEAVDKPIVDLPFVRACLGRLFAAANAKQRTTTSIPSFDSLLSAARLPRRS